MSEMMQIGKIKSPAEWLVLRKLYKKAFPKCEQKPLLAVWFVKQCGKGDVWIAEDERGFVGFAITMNCADMVLLDYLAIKENVRGSGIGTQVLKKLQTQYRGKRFFLEIENVYEPSEDQPQRLRRKRFYLKNGMKEMHIMVNAFGAELELLAYECRVSFEEYYKVYCSCYGRWAAKNLKELSYPGEKC